MPMYAALFLIAALSSMGLPALNGFIGEFTILLGAANRNLWWAVWAGLGIVLGAAYLLWLYQRVFWGPLDNPANKNVPDLNKRELGMLLALVAVMVWIGIYPATLFDMIEEPVNYIVRKVDPTYFDKSEQLAAAKGDRKMASGERKAAPVAPIAGGGAAPSSPLAATQAPLAGGASSSPLALTRSPLADGGARPVPLAARQTPLATRVSK
jgi:NADH-quinone oxidoreductase subunit M